MWKAIKGYEGFYEINAEGAIRRIARGKKLASEQADMIIAMLSHGATLKECSLASGVSITSIHNIKKGKTWQGNSNFRLVNPKPDTKGYPTVSLSKDGNVMRFRVHRLMWEAFVGPIESRLEINHKNMVKHDNRLENLELVTHQQNIQHAFDFIKNFQKRY